MWVVTDVATVVLDKCEGKAKAVSLQIVMNAHSKVNV